MNGQCPKCGHTELSESKVRMAGGFLSSIFEIQNQKFNTVTCESCGYTEFYDSSISTGEQIADLFLG